MRVDLGFVRKEQAGRDEIVEVVGLATRLPRQTGRVSP
jgi:hypothetical protein